MWHRSGVEPDRKNSFPGETFGSWARAKAVQMSSKTKLGPASRLWRGNGIVTCAAQLNPRREIDEKIHAKAKRTKETPTHSLTEFRRVQIGTGSATEKEKRSAVEESSVPRAYQEGLRDG
jgi:hypothetical protein